MRKLLLLIIPITLLMFMSACSGSSEGASGEPEKEQDLEKTRDEFIDDLNTKISDFNANNDEDIKLGTIEDEDVEEPREESDDFHMQRLYNDEVTIEMSYGQENIPVFQLFYDDGTGEGHLYAYLMAEVIGIGTDEMETTFNQSKSEGEAEYKNDEGMVSISEDDGYYIMTFSNV